MASAIHVSLGLLIGLPLISASIPEVVAPQPPPAQALVAADAKAPANCVSVTGALLGSPAAGKPYQPIKAKDPIANGTNLIALPFADIDSANGAVRLLMRADIGRRRQDAVLECEVTIRDAKDADMDVDVDHGRVVFENKKSKGEATVNVRIDDKIWKLKLAEPGTIVGMEVRGRMRPGMRPSVKDPTKPLEIEDPVTLVDILVTKGSAELTYGDDSFSMKAPPGPALFHWDSLMVKHEGPKALKELPPDIGPLPPDLAKRLDALVDRVKIFNNQPFDKALAECLKSNDPLTKGIGVLVAGGTDQIGPALDGLGDEKNPEIRDLAIAVLRQWIGEEKGNDQKLYDFLLKDRKLKPPAARGMLQLLYGFDSADLAQPELNAALVGMLRHERIEARELAHWHLVRIFPDKGKEIGYDAGAPEKQRDEAAAKWKKLLPPEKDPS